MGQPFMFQGPHSVMVNGLYNVTSVCHQIDKDGTDSDLAIA